MRGRRSRAFYNCTSLREHFLTVEMQDYEKVHLILMGNTLRFENKNDVSRIYDLKGSTFSRLVKGRTTQTSTLKDQNFVNNQHYVQEINLSW